MKAETQPYPYLMKKLILYSIIPFLMYIFSYGYIVYTLKLQKK